MQTPLWLAGTATLTLLAGGALAGSIVHGQTAPTPTPDAVPFVDSAALSRDVSRAVHEALESSGLRNGTLAIDVRRAVEEATRTAQEAVRELDVEVMLDDAFQEMPGMAMMGGRPRLGVRTRDVTTEEAKAAGLAGITGALVAEVPAESAAGKAGLMEKDIIVSVDGETIRSARQLARVIAESPDGRGLQIGYVRGTARSTVTVTPAAPSMTRRPGPDGADGDGPMVRRFERRVVPGRPGGAPGFDRVLPRAPGSDQEFFYRQGPEAQVRVRVGRGRLGVVGQPVTDQLATYFGVKEGVLVTRVIESSAAAQAGLKAGDVITSVNGKPVKDTGDILGHLEGAEDGAVVPVTVTREKTSQTIPVTLQAPSATERERTVTRRQRFTA